MQIGETWFLFLAWSELIALVFLLNMYLLNCFG